MSLQHFVPRFVLGHFSRPAGTARNKKFISVRDLAAPKTFQAALTRVAASNRFYDFVTESGETLSIDPFLTDIERVTAPAWRKLAQTERIRALEGRDREAFALFILTLGARGPSIRAQIEAVPDVVLDALRKRGEVVDQLREWLDESQGREAEIHASAIAHVAQHYSTIAKRTWLLFRPPIGRQLCISDSPVTQFNEIDYGFGSNLGLLTRGILPAGGDLADAAPCDSRRRGLWPQGSRLGYEVGRGQSTTLQLAARAVREPIPLCPLRAGL